MKVEVKKIDKIKRVVKIEVSGEAFLKDKKEHYVEIGKQIKVSGFRPGSAPLDVLEKYHEKTLKEEFLNRILPVYYQQALEDNKIIPAGLPRIYDVDFSKDSITFFAEFESRPELEIEETVYKAIKIKEVKPEVKEEELEKVITNLKAGMDKLSGKSLSDDELAKWAGYSDSNNLREAVRAEILIEKYRDRRRKIDNQISTHILKSVKIELPKVEVERHHKELVDREIYNMQNRGISAEDIEKHKKDIEEKLKTVAEDEVKLYYILEAIAKKENLKAEHNLGETVLGFVLSQAKYE